MKDLILLAILCGSMIGQRISGKLKVKRRQFGFAMLVIICLTFTCSTAFAQNLFVASQDSGPGDVYKIDSTSGKNLQNFSIYQPYGITYGPDGSLYVGSNFNSTANGYVSRYNSSSQLLSSFNISNPTGLAFSSAGDLYIGSQGSGYGDVYRVNSVTGQIKSHFTVYQPDGLAFGPDGYLYVSSTFNVATVGYIGKYDPETGHMVSSFNVNNPKGLAFSASGDLYVASQGSGQGDVYRLDSQSGKVLSSFSVWNPTSLAFAANGNLFVSSNCNASPVGYVGEYNPNNGKLIQSINVSCPYGITFEPVATPIPAAAWLMGSGLVGLAGLRRRRRVSELVAVAL